jgi:ariadne-1
VFDVDRGRALSDDSFKARELEGKVAVIKRKAFQVLSPPAIEGLQQEVIRDIVDLLSVNNSDAATLLRFYRWKRNELETEWFENAKKVQTKVGFTSMDTDNDVAIPSAPTFTCEFCGEDRKMEFSYALRCGHRTCNECWRGWVAAEFEGKGPNCIFTRCMTYKCTVCTSNVLQFSCQSYHHSHDSLMGAI